MSQSIVSALFTSAMVNKGAYNYVQAFGNQAMRLFTERRQSDDPAQAILNYKAHLESFQPIIDIDLRLFLVIEVELTWPSS